VAVFLQRVADRVVHLRIVTWNIHKGVGGMDGRYDLPRVARVLSELSPDIAFLQEVTENMPLNHGEHQAARLAEALGMRHMAFRMEHRFAIGGYGNLILSRWPLSRIHHVNLTIGKRKQRGALQARARVRVGAHSRSIALINMHLGLATSERAAQLERFLQSSPFSGLHGRTPIVVGGDLNDVWGSLGPRYLAPQGLARVGRLSNTFPAMMPLRPLDGLFVRGDIHAEHARVPLTNLTRRASDHLPIVADFRLPME
jgi:endonuclease/exonuclease/phosphatase family metal-dependent hydrolase